MIYPFSVQSISPVAAGILDVTEVEEADGVANGVDEEEGDTKI